MKGDEKIDDLSELLHPPLYPSVLRALAAQEIVTLSDLITDLEMQLEAATDALNVFDMNSSE